MYGLSEEAIPAVTKPLGAIFVRESPLREYPRVIAERSGIDLSVAYGIAYEVNKGIFLRFPEYFTDAAVSGKEWESKKSAPVVGPEEARKKVLEFEPWLLEEDEDTALETAENPTVEMPLLRAVGEYPKLGEQQITRERIAVPGKQDPVRPSLSNWIRSYRGELGIGYHEPVVRARFLFDSANGKGLSSEERERLNLIIRSIEENDPVTIDPKRSEIVFPSRDVVERSPSPRRGDAVSASVPSNAPVVSAVRDRVPAMMPSRPTPVPSVREQAPVSGMKSGPVPTPPPGLPVASPPQAPRRDTVSAPAFPPASPTVPTPSRPAPARSEGSLSFSSGHALPVERESDGDLSIRHEQRPAAPARTNPYSIRPVMGPFGDDHDSSGRVVDLREE